MVPEDLRCLNGCFDKYLDKTYLLKNIQQECSAIGLDRQIQTHTQEGYDLVQSNFSDLVNRPYLPLPLNPNLDCLVYYETKERKGCRSKNGVCNFIPGEDPNEDPRGNSGTQRKNDNIETNITDTNDYRSFILRAYSPATRAIEVCALAKIIQFHRYYSEDSEFATPEAVNLFSGDSPPTCDHFMPDIFGSLCSCIGTCAPRNVDATSVADPNLILHFHTDRGLWGCQDACRRTVSCEFYTLSKASFFEGQDNKYKEIPSLSVFQCFLWRKCDSFIVPRHSNLLKYEWSGPKDCALYDQICPIVGTALYPSDFTDEPCPRTTDTSCWLEVKYWHINCMLVVII